MLKNLQEILNGEVEDAVLHLWSDQLSEAEAAAIRTRVRNDPKYRDEFQGSLEILALMEGLEGDPAMEEIAPKIRRLMQKRKSRRNVALGMAAGMLMAIGASLAVFSPWRGLDDSPLEKYFTRIGEQQTIELDDGSVVTLNTGSRLAVDYSGQTRRILLERGEAYFEVADDPKRPFTVDLGLLSVTALGTAFNIRKNPKRHQVAVIEGAVALHESADAVYASPSPVSADGQAVVIFTPRQHRVEEGWVAEFDARRNELNAFRPESIDRYHDWRSGLLDFYQEPLFVVIEELNRYSRKKILVEDASVLELQVYTVIHIQDIDSALNSLEQVLPVEVTWYYDRVVITAAAPNERKDTKERP